MLERRLPRRGRSAVAITLVAAALAITILAPATVARDGRGVTPIVTAQVVKSGLVHPWDVAFTTDGRMFVTERPGRVRLYSSGQPGSTLLMTATIPVWASGESGLMGIAVDRAFDANDMVYVCRSHQKAGNEINQVLAYRFTGSTLVFDHWIIQNGMDASTIHNGCAVEHGPDLKLWITMGDAANASSAQDPDDLNGKVLRMNTNGTVPGDNPMMPGADAVTAIYAMGLRNPQGIAFQPGSQEPYTLEHGPDRDDEVNWIPSRPQLRLALLHRQ